MLTVLTPGEALGVIFERFAPLLCPAEVVGLNDALGRVLHEDVVADDFVPGFDRSTVDGYAVISSDTFGCSESIPAMLSLSGEVLMGHAAKGVLLPGSCIAVSTGGDLPEGADAVVMLEFTEDFGSGFIGINSPVAPGNNIIFKGDDVSPGVRILSAGAVLSPHDIGILAALGFDQVSVRPSPVVGIISTGDELVVPSVTPGRGQVRDVNSPMLMAAAARCLAVPLCYGIVRDDESALRDSVRRAVLECDVVLVSGGSSAGTRDLTVSVFESLGEILFHGIAMKPGKPTILGVIDDKPVFGLPGHPVAAFFVFDLFVRPLVARFMGASAERRSVTARLGEAVSSNHGREEYIQCTMYNVQCTIMDEGAGRDCVVAMPVRGKSGLIAGLAGTDGYICVPSDSEGLPKGAEVNVTLFAR